MTDQPEHLRRLNPEQHRAVTTTRGPLLILAGAGSGKTRVLTRRIAHLLHEGVDPKNVLAVTFTNKAASEMKERVIELVGEVGKELWVSTFHSTCGRILRYEIEVLGWTRRFAIYDDDDQLRIVKEIVDQLGYDRERVPPSSILSQIDHHKNRMAGSPEELIAQRRSHINDPLVRIWREYDDRLRAADALDFNDLIRLAVKLFTEHPDVLEKWQDRFHYVLVDEYQDTNRAQYQLLRLLTRKHRNLAVVGDDDQSIYGFRGADISNILDFERDFPDAAVIRLEQNYRCTKNILEVANTVVAQNTERMDKKLWTDGEQGHPVLLIELESPRDEAERVTRAILKLRRQGHAWRDMAIIYRTNSTSRVFESALRNANIPHKVVGGRKFTEHREIRDTVGYLRLLVNPADDAALLRIINVPTRGIGHKTLQALREDAAGRGEPLLKAARGRGSGKDAGSQAVGRFVALIDELTDAARELEPAEVVARVLDRSGYQASLEAESTPDVPERLANLAELLRDAQTFEPPPEALTPMERLRAWLDRLVLAGQDEELPEGGEVTLMTVHNSKGLEYPVVFVVHMMEGQFPHGRSLETEAEVSEERRLAYVAFTRAMRRLVITRSRTMPTTPGPERPGPQAARLAAPSRFLFGLPEQACEGDRPSGVPASSEEPSPVTMPETAKRKLRAFMQWRASSPAERAAPPVEEPGESYVLVELEEPGQLCQGVRVHHPRHGVGTVVRWGGGAQVSVRFAAGTMNISLREGTLHLVRD